MNKESFQLSLWIILAFASEVSGASTKLSQMNFSVATLPLAPWVMEKGDGTYEGFIVDILEEISKKAKVTFDLYLTKDGEYGMQNPSDNSWSGMIGDLVNKNADIAAGALIVTEKRKTVVDFSMPVQQTGQRILIQKPVHERHTLTFALRPFTLSVWIMVLVAYFLTALLLFVINKLSPSEWGALMEEDDPCELRKSFDIKNSLYFVQCTSGLQGFREAPRSPAGRIVTCAWFTYIIFFIAMYVSNMAALLTARPSGKMEVPFKTFQDLAMQSSDPFTMMVTSTRPLARMSESDDPLFKSIIRMIDFDVQNVRTVEDALAAIRQDGYAVIMDELTAEFLASTHCDVMVVGERILADDIAFACGETPTCNILDSALAELKQNGTLRALKRKWWGDYGKCPLTPINNYKSKLESAQLTPSPLDIAEVSFVFLVLAIGYILGLLLLTIECLATYMRKGNQEDLEPVRLTGAEAQSQSHERLAGTEFMEQKAPIAQEEP